MRGGALSRTRAYVDALCIDENETGERRVFLSPSERFSLLVRNYKTPTGWGYSRGTVTRTRDGSEICDIKRNYGGFHHTFIQKDAHEWLVAGRSYMSQTIVDLDAAREYEPPGDHYDGSAFCWARVYLSPDERTLAVDGCVWGWPYEYRFYDFTVPARGWAALPSPSVEVESERMPVWHADGTFETFAMSKGEVVGRTRFARDGEAVVVRETWLSDEESARRDLARAEDQAFEAEYAEFERSDPTLALVREIARAHGIDVRPALSRAARSATVILRRADPKASVDIRWDASSISVQLYTPSGDRSGEHSFALADVERALALIRSALP